MLRAVLHITIHTTKTNEQIKHKQKSEYCRQRNSSTVGGGCRESSVVVGVEWPWTNNYVMRTERLNGGHGGTVISSFLPMNQRTSNLSNSNLFPTVAIKRFGSSTSGRMLSENW